MMNTINMPSLYFINDKNIYDVLQGNKFSEQVLKEFLLRRGLVCGPQLTKNELIEMCISYPFGYDEYKLLMEKLEIKAHAPKYSVSKLENIHENINIEKVINSVRNQTKKNYDGFECNLDGNTHVITLTNTEIDFSKTELKQKQTQKIKIFIEQTNGNISIRYQAHHKATQCIDDFINELKKDKPTILPKQLKIDFEAFERTAEIKTKFFEKLLYSYPNYETIDVRKVEIGRIPTSNLKDENSIDINDVSIDENDVSIDENENDEVENLDDENVVNNITSSVKAAVLHGSNLLDSAEFENIKEAIPGVFISKVVWVIQPKDVTSNDPKLELEAGFVDQPTCADYKFSIRTSYKKRNQRTAKKQVAGGFVAKAMYLVSGSSLPPTEEKKVLRLLEDTSYEVYQQILAELEGDTDGSVIT